MRGYSWIVIPITWRNRRAGVPKLKIKEMGSRYFFIVAYVWLEKYFSRGDFRKVPESEPVAGPETDVMKTAIALRTPSGASAEKALLSRHAKL